jgi:hypothetical protein
MFEHPEEIPKRDLWLKRKSSAITALVKNSGNLDAQHMANH